MSDAVHKPLQPLSPTSSASQNVPDSTAVNPADHPRAALKPVDPANRKG
jgi:hypothetical protein